MKYFSPNTHFLFLGVFVGVLGSHFSLDAMSCASSFILQKKSNPDSIIMKENFLINPINEHKMTMVSMIREYGGWQMADYIYENIQKEMQDFLNSIIFSPDTKLFDVFSGAVNSINEIIKKSPDKNVHNTAATALITVFTGNNALWIANVGSCCAVVFGKNKKKSYLTFLNKPHISKPLLGGVLPGSNVFGYPEILLGTSNSSKYKNILEPKPDIFSYDIKKNDEFLILASYEVFDILSQKDVENICQSTQDPKSACCAIKKAVQEAINKKNVSITNVAVYVVNLSMQKERDVLMSLINIENDLDVVRKKIDNDHQKVVAIKKSFKMLETLLVSIGDCCTKLIGNKIFTIIKSWHYKIQLGLYSDSAMSQKLTKEIDRSFDHLLAAVYVSDIRTFLSNEQVEEIVLWRNQFNPDYFN